MSNVDDQSAAFEVRWYVRLESRLRTVSHIVLKNLDGPDASLTVVRSPEPYYQVAAITHVD